ncbi:MAG: hypothetical protein KGJ02_06205 [Verrucomicrobiota bacterium]|nr:hypothetical protein [Verrucomicrobiota bacterium]
MASLQPLPTSADIWPQIVRLEISQADPPCSNFYAIWFKTEEFANQFFEKSHTHFHNMRIEKERVQFQLDPQSPDHMVPIDNLFEKTLRGAGWEQQLQNIHFSNYGVLIVHQTASSYGKSINLNCPIEYGLLVSYSARSAQPPLQELSNLFAEQSSLDFTLLLPSRFDGTEVKNIWPVITRLEMSQADFPNSNFYQIWFKTKEFAKRFFEQASLHFYKMLRKKEKVQFQIDPFNHEQMSRICYLFDKTLIDVGWAQQLQNIHLASYGALVVQQIESSDARSKNSRCPFQHDLSISYSASDYQPPLQELSKLFPQQPSLNFLPPPPPSFDQLATEEEAPENSEAFMIKIEKEDEEM